MNLAKGMNRNQLKLIAISAMVCDHFAWGFLDFMSPLSQILHVIGRFTIPIMCFFVAEGFKKTSDINKYILRMMSFWIISIVPFYMFFHNEYGYRQNIIFDLLLGLLMLTICESKKIKKITKIGGVILISVVSLVIGGWPIIPMLYILVFYYAKDFKSKAKGVCILTIMLVLFLGIAIELNNIWHFAPYDWHWYEKLYFLGFILPLFVLRKYNGNKGKEFGGRYFFYLFYPAHFLVLYVIKKVMLGVTFEEIYIFLHVLAIVVEFIMIILAKVQKPSHAQNGFLICAIASMIYTFGFLVEITSVTMDGVFAAIKIEYFGECLVVIGFTWFMKEFWKKDIPKFIFVLEIFITYITMWSIFTVEGNHIFYKSMTMEYGGPLPRIILEYGIGFYLFLLYLGVFCLVAMLMAFVAYKKSHGVEKKRMQLMFYAPICLWLPYVVRELGLTGGYEIPSIGIMATVFLIGMAVIRYGYFDSLSLARENALNHAKEGVLVIDLDNRVLYYNKIVKQIFGDVTENIDVYKHNILGDVFNGNIKNMQINDAIYEMRIEALKEGGYNVGYMLWVINITEYHKKIMQISEDARKDPLTGVDNRGYYEIALQKFIDDDGIGTMFMLDLDNFKGVNDTFGHQAGDEVLIMFSDVLKSVVGNIGDLCRIGGDEFSIFIRDIVNQSEIDVIAKQLIEEFQVKIAGTKYKNVITTSIGIAVYNGDENLSYEELYSRADKALYFSKNNGKNMYHYY